MSMRGRVAICSRVLARPGVAAIGCLVLLAACGRAPDEPEIVSTDDVVLRDDAPAEVRKPLEPGAWLVEVRERDIDVHATVATGDESAELRESAPRHGAIYWVVSLESPAELRVALRSADHHTWRGSASIRVARFARAPADAPSDVEKGYRAWSEAGRQNALGTLRTGVHAGCEFEFRRGA